MQQLLQQCLPYRLVLLAQLTALAIGIRRASFIGKRRCSITVSASREKSVVLRTRLSWSSPAVYLLVPACTLESPVVGLWRVMTDEDEC
jgi:hypothetical protein